MSLRQSLQIIEGSEASARLQEAQRWVEARAGGGALIVSASRGAADDLARVVAASRGATVGLHRYSFAQLAARLAAPVLATRGLAPLTLIGSEAVAARATFDALQDDGIEYFAAVAATPGFPRALARTLQDLAMAGVRPERLTQLPLGGRDLARLLEAFERQFVAASATGRAALFAAAAEGAGVVAHLPLLLLDVPLESNVEFELARRLISAAPETLITVPFGDLATLDYLRTLKTDVRVLQPSGDADLTALRRYLFAARQPPERAPKGDVRLFSAPGEGRECVEIARRILDEARAGVPFDDMAVFLRSPREYLGLLENAFERAGIDAWFDRGTRRPHPSGRAFLAILSCKVERLSALRFAEYLSLAQVPEQDPSQSEGLAAEVLPPADDFVSGFAHIATVPDLDEPEQPLLLADDDSPIVDGALRAPWRWERLIVESSVVGGKADRWRKRLAGLQQGYETQKKALLRDDPESPRLAGLEVDLQNLRHLSNFALPIVEELESWPAEARWGEWIERFGILAPKILRRSGRVRRVLGELSAMSAIGPISLEEARDVLAERLRTFDEQPPVDRYGRVFVGSPHQARGRAFRVVFVPGLAERLFPQKLREDPLLLDKEMREPLAAGLLTQNDRAKTERLLLRLAVGGATERLWLSYPRLDVASSRPRVPSFYLLDVMRAITGRIPHHENLQRDAAEAGGARLDWPAPPSADKAIDDIEHDLATLKTLLDRPDQAAVRGEAHYLLGLNTALRRSVTRRWVRARARWRPEDGIVRVAPATAPVLERHRLNRRAYSVSALQKFATCPYQFVLSAIYRFALREAPEPLQRLNPLQRGSLFHEVQARVMHELKRSGRLPLARSDVDAALRILSAAMLSTAATHHERLAPAIERVWGDEIAALERDLRVWIRKMPDAGPWIPEFFEYSFGLDSDGGDDLRDKQSRKEPVTIDGRFVLRGAIDVIESHKTTNELRVTDHKTGRNRAMPKTVIEGGSLLQPVIYGLAIEQMFGRPVREGRLFYATTAGGFMEHAVPLTDANRRIALEALEIVDRAIELGILPAAPRERACTWCDFRSVCGPDEGRRVARKNADLLSDLAALRNLP
jgi:ATP-dependent helicase/nuclease subunit B